MERDLNGLHLAIKEGLPVYSQWRINESSLAHDFTMGHQGLGSEVNERFIPNDLERFNLFFFGEYSHDDGGGASGWIGIGADGRVYAVDLAQTAPLLMLNSSLAKFIKTFHTLDEFLGQDMKLPHDIAGTLRSVDRQEYPNSEWRILVEYLTLE